MSSIDRRSFLQLGTLSLAAWSFPRGTRPIPPRANRPLPSPAQLEWQRDELAMFLHFGVNTFTNREWGDGSESPSIFNPTALDARQWARTAKRAGFKAMVLTAKHQAAGEVVRASPNIGVFHAAASPGDKPVLLIAPERHALHARRAPQDCRRVVCAAERGPASFGRRLQRRTEYSRCGVVHRRGRRTRQNGALCLWTGPATAAYRVIAIPKLGPSGALQQRAPFRESTEITRAKQSV